MPDVTYLVGTGGPRVLPAGGNGSVRLGRLSEVITADGHGRYHEAARTQTVYSLTLPATTTTIAAGHIVAAAAAEVVQFAIWNPVGSGKLLSLLKFGMGVISGTPTAGPLFHGFLATGPSIATTATAGAAVNNFVGGAAPTARYVNTAASTGTAMTGASAVGVLRVADFATTATAQASVNIIHAVEDIGGDIILPPGTGWVPLWRGAGTTMLNSYSITWEELDQ